MGYGMIFVREPDGGRTDTPKTRGYFELNVWGMRRAREAMNRRGMLCVADPIEDWPQRPATVSTAAYDWVCHPEDRTGEPPNAADLEQAERHLREVTEYRRAHSGECPGIPVHKLGTNDGWIVTPVEIRAALGALARCRPDLDHALAFVIREGGIHDFPDQPARHRAQQRVTLLGFHGFGLRGAAGTTDVLVNVVPVVVVGQSRIFGG